ncbi:LysR family transcriptional regulator [Burkholderia multivorans]|nr:LysR family transcriptional regulator [Burkholderia multivorans]
MRRLPPLHALQIFSTVARHGSFTRAAEQLCVTQGAVSRQIQTLEAHYGFPLFKRACEGIDADGRRRTAAAGRQRELRADRGATLQAMSHQAGAGTLRLATLPTFGSKWLLPHLHDFYAAHPGVTVHLHSRIGNIDFHVDDLDAAIAVGTGDWPGLHAHRLYNEFLIAIASPDAPPDANGERAPAWAARQTLLGVTSNQHAWAEWFAHYRLDHRQMRIGPSFELTSHLIQAVRAGMGIGLVPKVLVEDELSRNELVSIGDAITSRRSYYLVYPPENESLPSLAAFRDWLMNAR